MPQGSSNITQQLVSRPSRTLTTYDTKINLALNTGTPSAAVATITICSLSVTVLERSAHESSRAPLLASQGLVVLQLVTMEPKAGQFLRSVL